MKKLYSLALLLISAVTFAQSVVITRVVAGSLPSDGCAGATGSTSPKITELYVSGTVDFTNYRLQIESNGAVDAPSISWTSGLDLSPLGTVTNSFVYLVGSGIPTFTEMYPSITLPSFSASSINGNGNDAYRIVITDGALPTPAVVAVVDQFGNPLDVIGGSADYGAPWAYQLSYAKRVDGTGPNGGTFVTSSFTYGGNNAFFTPNNNCGFISNAISLGTFVLAKQDFAIAGLKVYPNPVVNGNLYITSDSNAPKQVAIFDVLGKLVIKTSANTQPVNVSGLSSGVYMVKITENGKTATRKLVIQ